MSHYSPCSHCDLTNGSVDQEEQRIGQLWTGRTLEVHSGSCHRTEPPPPNMKLHPPLPACMEVHLVWCAGPRTQRPRGPSGATHGPPPHAFYLKHFESASFYILLQFWSLWYISRIILEICKTVRFSKQFVQIANHHGLPTKASVLLKIVSSSLKSNDLCQ